MKSKAWNIVGLFISSKIFSKGLDSKKVIEFKKLNAMK